MNEQITIRDLVLLSGDTFLFWKNHFRKKKKMLPRISNSKQDDRRQLYENERILLQFTSCFVVYNNKKVHSEFK